MTLNQIRAFEAVSKYLNITRAAESLSVSEPSVFKQVKSLEDFCGVRLYRKVGRRIELTREGRLLQPDIREILTRVERLGQRFKQVIPAPNGGALAVGGSHVPSKSVLPSYLAVFKQSNPLVQITLQTRSSRNIERALMSSAVDIAIITHPLRSPHLRYLPFGQQKVVLFVSSQHQLADKKDLSLAEIAAVPLIIHRGIRRGTGKNTLDILKRIEELGSPPTILMESNSGEAVKAAVLKGTAMGILMQAHLDNEIQKGEVKILKIRDLGEMSVSSCVVYKKDKTLSDNAQKFLDMLKRSGPMGRVTARRQVRLRTSNQIST